LCERAESLSAVGAQEAVADDRAVSRRAALRHYTFRVKKPPTLRSGTTRGTKVVHPVAPFQAHRGYFGEPMGTTAS